MTRKQWDKAVNYDIYAQCKACRYFMERKNNNDYDRCQLMQEAGVKKSYNIIEYFGCCNQFIYRFRADVLYPEPTKKLPATAYPSNGGYILQRNLCDA